MWVPYNMRIDCDRWHTKVGTLDDDHHSKVWYLSTIATCKAGAIYFQIAFLESTIRYTEDIRSKNPTMGMLFELYIFFEVA